MMQTYSQLRIFFSQMALVRVQMMKTNQHSYEQKNLWDDIEIGKNHC